jgi:hypothetical protein
MSGNIDEDEVLPSLDEKDKLPINAEKRIRKTRSRKKRHGNPDFIRALDPNEDSSLSDPHDKNWMKNLVSDPFSESVRDDRRSGLHTSLSPDMMSTLKKMSNSLGIVKQSEGLLTEGEEEIDLNVEE